MAELGAHARWQRPFRWARELARRRGAWSGHDRASGVGECPAERLARADVELLEHLAQVVLDRARADEQLGADLRVGVPLAGEIGDLRLLGREDVARLARPSAHRLAGRQQLAPGALGEGVGPEVAEHLVGGTEVLARVYPSVLAPEPFAVEQMGAGEFDSDPSALEPFDRLAVVALRVIALAHQRPSTREDPEGPIRACGLRPLL